MTGFCAVYSSAGLGWPALACLSAEIVEAAVAADPGNRCAGRAAVSASWLRDQVAVSRCRRGRGRVLVFPPSARRAGQPGAVQALRVGVDKIRELRGVMAARNVKRGQFATTSTFTPDEQAELLAVALDGDYWRPTCVNCGVKRVDRTPRQGGSAFWGCAPAACSFASLASPQADPKPTCEPRRDHSAKGAPGRSRCTYRGRGVRREGCRSHGPGVLTDAGAKAKAR